MVKNSVFQSILKLSIFSTILLFFVSGAFATGVLDPSFGTGGKASAVVSPGLNFASAVVIQPDGKIVVVGSFVNGTYNDSLLVRFNPNGSLDNTFGSGGKVVAVFSDRHEQIRAVALQPDGKIVVAGEVESTATSSVDFLVARFTANGALDTSFGTGGVATVNQGTNDYFQSVAVQPDGKIIGVGSTSDGIRAAVIRFNANGTLDLSFANGGLFYIDVPNTSYEGFASVVLYPNGRIVAGGLGNATTIGGVNVILLSLEPNGTPTTQFGTQGLVVVNEFVPPNISLGFDMTLQPDGKIITVSAGTRRFLPSGALDTSFKAGALGVEPYGSHVALRPDGKLAIIRYNPEDDTIISDANGRYIGRARNIVGNDIAAQSDNKLVLINSGYTVFSVTRLSAITSQATRLMDYNRDDRTDFGVYQPSPGIDFKTYRFLTSGNSQFNLTLQTTELIPEYDQRADQSGEYRQTFIHWWRGVETVTSPRYYETTADGQTANVFDFGLREDIPTGGDFNGDTLTDLTLFRPSDGTWYAARSDNNTYSIVKWGISGDKPVPADYDYDGKTDYAIYRPSTGTWWILRSSDGAGMVVRFGLPTDIPLTGDFDGDGRADFTVYRPSEGNWYHLLTTEGFKVIHFGISTDIPVPGDYDGDGIHDQAVYRNGLWYLLQSRDGFRVVFFGQSGELPVSIRYDE